MHYLKLHLPLRPNTEIHRDLLAALLAETGFESFVATDDGLEAFVPEPLYSEQAVMDAIARFPLPGTSIRYRAEKIADRDWNEAWEKHFFEPIVIDDQVVIHSSFHRNIPVARYRIAIDPKMAFGTGHHATTALMVSYLAALDLTGRSFLDMGCGTSVLAILARLKGATPVTAIDIDEWSYRNSLENIQLNHTPDIRVLLGDAGRLSDETFDVVAANINRNILLQDIPVYARCMQAGASLFMSGFYPQDREMIRERCEQQGLQFVSSKEKEHWTAVHYIK
jgi:ribosomal protein L11 methyltransferase